MNIGGVFVDSGKELGKDPTPVGIIMMGLDNQEYQYSIRGNTLEDSTRFNGISDTNWDLALKLMAKKEKDGKFTVSLVNSKGKSIYDSTLVDISKKSHIKGKANGIAIGANYNTGDIMFAINMGRRGKTLSIGVPSEVWTKHIDNLSQKYDDKEIIRKHYHQHLNANESDN